MTGMPQIFPIPVKDANFGFIWNCKWSVESTREEKETWQKNHKAAPSLAPFSASVWGWTKNLLTWVKFRSVSFPDFDEQVYNSTRYLLQDRMETEIHACTSVVTGKTKEKKIIFWEEMEEEKPRKQQKVGERHYSSCTQACAINC